MDHLLTTVDVASILHISLPTLYKFMRRGQIPYYKIGANRRFSAEDVERFVEHNKLSNHPEGEN